MDISDRILITINEDATVCECTILPKVSEGPNITFPEVIEYLNSHGVIYGIDESAIIENLMLAEHNTEKVSFIAARAIAPKDGEKGQIRLHISFPFETRIGSFQTLSGSRVIAGQLILTINNENLTGEDGISVLGKPIPAKNSEPLKIQPGKNVKIEKEGDNLMYYAITEGIVTLENNEFLYIKPVSDGWFDIQIKEDNLKLFLSIYLPSEGGKFVDEEEILNFITARGIKLNYEKISEIKKIIFKHVTERINIENYLLLEGIPPINGHDSRIEFKVSIEPVNMFSLHNSTKEERIDFHKVLAINSVKKGQLIAEKIPATDAIKDGIDIFGNIIKAKAGKDNILLQPGKNIQSVDGKNFYSTINGQLKLTGNQFWVNPVFLVEGDLNLSIGDINFTGDIVVEKNVPDNFQIKTDESVFIGQNISATDVYTGRDLIVGGGILNKKKSKIIVQGSLYARFIENSGNIEVNGDVIVSDYILQSEIITKGYIILKGIGKGQIIGGELWAGKGIIARNVGNETEIPTKLCVGDYIFIKHTLEMLEKEIIKIQEKLKTVKELPAKETYHLNNLIKWKTNLSGRLSTDKRCFIKIEKNIYPKTEFMLHDKKIFFKNVDSFKSFIYEPAEGRVITENFNSKGLEDI